MPAARPVHKVDVLSPRAGYVAAIQCERVGTACVILGGGRERKEDSIDPAVGFVLHKKVATPSLRANRSARSTTIPQAWARGRKLFCSKVSRSEMNRRHESGPWFIASSASPRRRNEWDDSPEFSAFWQ